MNKVEQLEFLLNMPLNHIRELAELNVPAAMRIDLILDFLDVHQQEVARVIKEATWQTSAKQS